MKYPATRAAPFVMLLSGFGLWSLAFLVLYGVQATGCRLGWQSVDLIGWLTLQRIVLVILFLGFVSGHFALYRRLKRRHVEETVKNDRPGAFTRQAGARLALAALGAAVFCFAGIFWLSTC